MRPLEELLDRDEPAIDLIREWVAAADVACEILPPSETRADALVQTQVTTRSPLGAVVYETGGVLVDDGWLRILGSGHPRLPRTLPGWNADHPADGCYLVADDVVGGFFALNGGAFGESDRGDVYYWPPDTLEWEPMGAGYTEFFQWCLTPSLHDFYESLRWPGWRDEVGALPGDRCYSYFPFLWTAEGSVTRSHRGDVPVGEAFAVKVDIVEQLR